MGPEALQLLPGAPGPGFLEFSSHGLETQFLGVPQGSWGGGGPTLGLPGPQ